MTLSEQHYTGTGDALWQSVSGRTLAPVDERIRQLIGITGSLTRGLRSLCGDRFKLRLLGEREARDGRGRIREVLMLCGELPWVFAQTVIPQTTLRRNPWLSRLGERPLGDSLFERPHVERSGLFLARLTPGHRLYERAVADAEIAGRPEALWARRSVIRILESELSINEVFFPAAGDCAKA